MTRRVAVCVKWVDLRPEVDPLTGAVRSDARDRGASPADRAALEVGLRLAAAWGAGLDLVVAGPPSVDGLLRELGAVGASRLVRVDVDPDLDSAAVARALTGGLAGADVVVCGDHSLDRGSGSVPAFLAHGLGAAAATGLTAVHVDGPGRIAAVRRLGGGRSERIAVSAPAVLSVEGAVATLRRAPLTAVLESADRPIDVVAAPGGGDERLRPGPLRPWRPPPRLVPAPEGETARERIVALTGAMVERTPPRTVEADPAGAAEAIVEQLRAWGYLA